jgi:hypothetical protein
MVAVSIASNEALGPGRTLFSMLTILELYTLINNNDMSTALFSLSSNKI